MTNKNAYLLGAARSIDLFGGLSLSLPPAYVRSRAQWGDWEAVGEDLYCAFRRFRPSDADDASAEQLPLFD